MKETIKTRNCRPLGGIAAALAAALIVGASSCKKEGTEGATPSMTGGYFTAVTQPHTGDGKTHLNDLQVEWDNNDQVRIFNSNGEDAKFTATIRTDGAPANTRADLKTSSEFAYDQPYFAVYPYGTGYTFDKDAVKISSFTFGGETQQYVDGGFSDEFNPMAAYYKETATTKDGTTVELQFKNLCGLLRFKLTGHGEKVKYIKIKSRNGEALYGRGTISVGTDGKPSFALDPTTKGNDEITLECGESVKLTNAATTFHVLLAPCRLEKGFSMEIVNSFGTHVCTKYVTNEIKIEGSKVYDVNGGGMDGSLEILPIDLSAYDGGYETANCYIVSEGGLYMFPCDIKGNGTVPTGPAYTVLSGSDHVNFVISDYKSASVVWETVNTADKPNQGTVVNYEASTSKEDGHYDVKVKENYVYFYAGNKGTNTFTPGNALIAVHNDAGNILWSWHIWCVSKDDQPKAVGTHSLMDRSLGALSATTGDQFTAGLLYQWGRKDPLFGPANYKESTSSFMNSVNDSKPISDAGDTEGERVSYTIKNPGTFIYNSSGTCDWFTIVDPTGAEHRSNGLWDPEQKTMYDPCPHGWRVPEIGGSTSGGSVTNHTWGGSWEGWDSTTKGRVYDSGFYPASGNRRNSDGTLNAVGGYGFSWSCSPCDWSSSTHYAYYLSFYDRDVDPSNSNGRAFGFPVRPVQESSSSSK